MDKNQNNIHQKNDDMSKPKTNQDYNKQKPNPNDPNQTNKHQIGEDEEKENPKKKVTAQTENNKTDLHSRDEGYNDAQNKNDVSKDTSKQGAIK